MTPSYEFGSVARSEDFPVGSQVTSSRNGLVEATDNWWYSPQCMLLFADLAIRPYAADGTTPPGDLQKAVDEARAGTIFALGLADFVGAESWMRLVHPREQAPDIRIMYVDDSGPKGSHAMRTLRPR